MGLTTDRFIRLIRGMQAENKAMGLQEDSEEAEEEAEEDEEEGHDAESTAGLDVHSALSTPLFDDGAPEPIEPLPAQGVQAEDEQETPEGDKTSKGCKGKGKAEPIAAPRLPKAEKKAREREATLQSALGKEEASDDDIPKSSKKSKRKTQNGIIDTMAAVTGASTPVELEPWIEGDTLEMQSPKPGAAPEMSKRDKRRAKEAAKKAQQEAAPSSTNLVSHDVQFDLCTKRIEKISWTAVQRLSTNLRIEDQALQSHQGRGTCCCNRRVKGWKERKTEVTSSFWHADTFIYDCTTAIFATCRVLFPGTSVARCSTV
jgi:hypothetical protein